MHLRDGTEQILDPEGLEFPNIETMRKAVLVSARDLMTGERLSAPRRLKSDAVAGRRL